MTMNVQVHGTTRTRLTLTALTFAALKHDIKVHHAAAVVKQRNTNMILRRFVFRLTLVELMNNDVSHAAP